MSNFGIRMIPKVHIVLHHLPHFIHLTNMPLGPSSEQVVEEQHARFIPFLIVLESVARIISPTRTDFSTVFYIKIPPI